ncbi:tetratricopeptide repeat protein [Kibdelosporangium aridum]|uniref:Tetratricopeptide repeat protein n=1 Tax=Kibdelosporangium aridum TaxID=2030 RepID=A0A428Z9P3_KIBAR|nr:tetratricopeptide repeat protein [Kibdelosporangium aridum]RSM84782.1 tetratricopeptide repeat protein [Kibdelosporangium aridum]
MALCLRLSGDAAGARETYAQLVHQMRQKLGRLHHETLIARHNLAYWRSLAGNVDSAISEFTTAGRRTEAVAQPTDLIDEMARVQGANNPRTLEAVKLLDGWA